jgi:hypothetical protein
VADATAVGWRRLREFAGVDVSRSYVLSWRVDRDALLVDADIALLPEHPFYEPPRRREKACMRAAIIEFPGCVGLDLEGQPPGGDLRATAGALPAGAIENLERRDEGPYVLTGGFGTVAIDAERPILRLQQA